MIMRCAAYSILLLIIRPIAVAGCIPFNEAPKHIGETRCVKGKVLHVGQSRPGFESLSFCEDQQNCAFTALVTAGDTETAASLRELQGKTIKVHGLVKESNGDALIVLQDSRELLPDDSEVPSFMKTYDVEERGHYSAGTSHAPKAKRTTTKKQTATLPIDIPEDTEEAEPATP